ncbi:MAG: hypothetical protein KGN77_15860 [Xanthomonadaceae bacterium]|nr:hypothetical protein [Xanthomonadaceae bacterium]MDE1964740.1 hypothetical protein [Xanthomonadaceae bacterium]
MVVVIGDWLDLPVLPTLAVAALACSVLRMLAVRRGSHLPVAGGRHQGDPPRDA